VNLDVSELGIDAATFAASLDERGVRGLPGLGNIVRFVTYRGITRDNIDRAVSEIREMVELRPWSVDEPSLAGGAVAST
jgi:threonine aldolase